MTADRDADLAVAAGRLSKAEEFADAAAVFVGSDGTIESTDAFATLAVHAGIAACDAICIRRLGRYSPTGSHSEAVALLRRADPDAAKHLERLLSLKTKAGYSARPISATEAQGALRAYRELLTRARRS
ncbi:DUF4129 domain-containing protein [Rathayibacter sp. VKM Ac-2857]|uniref:DUF4129 domain-containing protein n=1 Tax=Rathayibacter sp. VKM Ac-2857 TaxID=2739020 RepID=UPI0015664085|nr:DUF4129 domain-containing protein [Rathayibacter sp. VKM Ac-2857]NQX17444.1 DUF4129 domain-containing protein [Rathayibacter sp. VKM Ac-2857]